MNKYTSGRVRKTPQSGITSDRYDFLGLDQAEPDLGDPLVGPSSVGANPIPLSGIRYVLLANGNKTGKRYWVPAENLSTGFIPGSFSVFNNDYPIGLANSFNKFNFVGSGVTVDPVGYLPEEQTGIATVRITVTDFEIPGNVNTIPYKDISGYLRSTPDFVYVSGNVGIGSTSPKSNLDVLGTGNFSGIVTSVGGFSGSLSGTATTATNLSDAANILSGTISSSRLSGSYNIDITGTATTATYLSNAANITTGTISSSRLSGSYGIDITGTATTATYLSNAANITTGTISSSRLSGSYGIDITGTATTALNLPANININTSGIITASTFYGSFVGPISTTTTQFDQITINNKSTFTNGPIVVGTQVTTGNASQKIQVAGDAYISGNLGVGTTNPITPLQVEIYGIKSGIGTFIASSGVSTSIDTFSITSSDFKTAEYTIHIGFGTNIQSQKVLVMQNQSVAYSEEYAVMYNNSLIVSIGATISSGSCLLLVTPQTGINGLTTYRFIRQTII